MGRKRLSNKWRKPPQLGDVVQYRDGLGTLIKIISYDEVIEEMKSNGVALKDILRFLERTRHFLADASLYYECEIQVAEETIRIDWSDWDPLT